MTFSVAYGHPAVLAVRGLAEDQACQRARVLALQGRPNVRVVDERGRPVWSPRDGVIRKHWLNWSRD